MRIYLSKENRKRILEKYGCNPSTVSEALSFRKNSLTSLRIRSDAMNLFNGYYFDVS